MVTNYLFLLLVYNIFNCFSTDTFDVDKMKEATKLFLGLHDFRSFMGKGSSQPEKVTRRIINKLDFTEACSACYSPYSWPQCMSNDKSEYRFFDIYIKSSGFLYNQVSNKQMRFCLMRQATHDAARQHILSYVSKS